MAPAQDNDIVTAAVLVIGDEILSGRTKDKNIGYIADHCTQIGIQLREVRIVADDEADIVAAVNALRGRYDYVFTTGGIGPTHDDITAQSIARAFGVPLVEHPHIAALLRQRAASPEIMAARMRMALVPQGAQLIENSTGGPPGFYVDNVYVLAGIPVVMRAMLATLGSKLRGGAVLQSRSVTAYLGESAIADPLARLQQAYPMVEIGSYPFDRDGRYGTTLVLRCADAALLEEATEQLKAIIVRVGAEPIGE